MRALYGAWSGYDDDDRMGGFLKGIFHDRRDYDPHTFTSVLPKAIQYLFLEDENDDYTGYGRPEWTDFVEQVIGKQQEGVGKSLSRLLVTKRNNATIRERYLPPELILKSRFPGQSIELLDAGCSAGIGIRAIERGQGSTGKIDDQTDDQISKQLKDVHLRVSGGVGIDLENLENQLAWVVACSLHFNEVDKLGFRRLFKWLDSQEKSNIGVRQANILDRDLVVESGSSLPGYHLEYASFDAAMILTSLFQMNDSDVVRALGNLRRATKPGGLVIAQDFFGLEESGKIDRDTPKIPLKDLGIEDPRFIVRYRDIYGGHAYRTLLLELDHEQRFSRAMEVFVLDGGKCHQILPGTDYQSFLESAANM